jgi:phage major head subunit gpT-like protein
MLINAASLGSLFEGFNVSFNKGMEGAPSNYRDIAMVVPSGTKEQTYGWLGQFPAMREWIGDRHIKNLAAHGYTVVNRLFESTISVKRTHIEDDQFGVFGPIVQETGRAAGEQPDKLVFELLAAGFTTLCYDGQNFFDDDHPVSLGEAAPVSVSNMQAGGGPAWFLLDTSRAIRPLLYQPRIAPVFQQFTKDSDERVFWQDEYIYGVRARSNAGFGLWQLAFASNDALTAANYEAARQALTELVGDEGRPLGIRPDVLVVPPALEGAGLRLLNNGSRVETVGAGDSVALTNEWAGTAKLIVSPWLT